MFLPSTENVCISILLNLKDVMLIVSFLLIKQNFTIQIHYIIILQFSYLYLISRLKAYQSVHTLIG